MSESSLSNGIPPDTVLEQALRKAVEQVYKNGNLEELTVKRIRKLAEGDLDLPDGFYKTDDSWKERSKIVIQSEVDAHTDATASSQPASSQPVPKQKQAHPSRAEKSKVKTKGTKRASTEDAEPKRRRKKDALDTDSAEETREPVKRRPATKSKGHRVASTAPKALSGNEKDEQIASMLEEESDSNGMKLQESESEMSELLDEEPKPKRRRKSRSVTKPTSTKSETKGKNSSNQPTDPDAEDIKRLQGWLIKCGIRKMWFKELAPYDTSKAKIHHLKDMLTDAGMTGRYSTEKASQIKEERELKADLEAVQEGAKQWGKADSEVEDSGGGRPRRRLAKGLQGLDFLNDDDGEETD